MTSYGTADEWWPDDDNSVVVKYQQAHFEFDIEWQSGRPYGGIPASKLFERKGGSASWKLRSDKIGSSLTADLLAAAESLRLPRSGRVDGGSPAGVHAEGGRWWLPLLDGGLFVEFTQWEHQSTNRVCATQRVWILGTNAYRLLLDALEIALPTRRAPGESEVWTGPERLERLEQQRTRGTKEHAAIAQLASRWPSLPTDERV